MRPVLLAFVLVPLLVAGQPARGSDVPIDVKIRVETFGRLSPSSVMRMRQEVESIWKPLSVRLVWTVVAESVHPSDATVPNADITILIENKAPWPDYAPSPETLAHSTLYHPPDGSRIAVIVTSIERTRLFVDRMLNRTDQPLVLADRLVPLVLGRAIAHEIGHYLLDSSTHSQHGLMRARFGPDDARVIVPRASIALDSAQVLAMKKRWPIRQPIALAANGQK